MSQFKSLSWYALFGAFITAFMFMICFFQENVMPSYSALNWNFVGLIVAAVAYVGKFIVTTKFNWKEVVSMLCGWGAIELALFLGLLFGQISSAA